MVMAEMEKPRDTFLLMRGQYDKHGAKVTAGPARRFAAVCRRERPANRLGLAQWLVSPSQPLTARVIVNRYWQMYFGTGIVKTAEDFGSAGGMAQPPGIARLAGDGLHSQRLGHSEDAKAHRDERDLPAILASSAGSRCEMIRRTGCSRADPRFRLPAEFIRDQALAISGLLNRKSAAKASLRTSRPGCGRNWLRVRTARIGRPRYIRKAKGRIFIAGAMYTFWKRTSPPPTLSHL